MGPSPYEAGRAFGNAVSRGYRSYQDRTALDDILERASNSEDPNAINDAMAQILQHVSPNKQQAALGILQQKQKNIENRNETKRAEMSLMALEDLRGLPRGTLTSFGTNTKLAEQASRPQKQNAGPIGSQPVPPQISESIIEIVTNNPDANADELRLLMDKAGIPPSYSNPYTENRRKQDEARQKNELEEKTNRRKFGQEIGKKVLESADSLAESLPQKETALNLMNEAISNKDLSFFTRDNLAEITGIEKFRSKEGALFKTAGKEYFLGNLSRAGARPNQWIEQQIAEMLPKIGRDTEANLSVTRALRNELELDKERIRLTNEISNEIDEGKGTYKNLGSRVNEELSKFAQSKQKELFNDLRAIKAISEGKNQKFMPVSKGTPISKYMAEALRKMFPNDKEKARQEAKKLGYTF